MEAELVAPDNLLPHFALTKRGNVKPIEFLGELNIRKRQQLDRLEEISLRSLGVSRVASPAVSLENYGHLREMDLAGNLLSDWKTVVDLMKQFPNLEILSLAFNRIRDLEGEMAVNEFPKMVVLNLNHCHVRSFETIRAIARSMPNLEQLCVAQNPLEDDADDGDAFSPIDGFDKLSLIDCSNCSISSWEKDIRRFRFLPHLETLILDGNSIPRIPPSPPETRTEFPSLISLHLADNAFENWADLEGIKCLPKILSLRLRNNAVTKSIGAGAARAILIARLPTIEHLNASPVSEKERTEAERVYIRTVALEILTASNTTKDPAEMEKKKEGVLSLHPNFTALMEKHGDSMVGIMSGRDGSGGNLGSYTLNVTIKSMVASSCTVEPLRKRLPGSLTVGRLKSMCARAFKLDADVQILHFRMDKDPFPTELDNDENTLSYYGVRDGAEILMDEIDIKAKKKENASKDDFFNRRIEEQEKSANAIQQARRKEMSLPVVDKK